MTKNTNTNSRTNFHNLLIKRSDSYFGPVINSIKCHSKQESTKESYNRKQTKVIQSSSDCFNSSSNIQLFKNVKPGRNVDEKVVRALVECAKKYDGLLSDLKGYAHFEGVQTVGKPSIKTTPKPAPYPIIIMDPTLPESNKKKKGGVFAGLFKSNKSSSNEKQ